MNRSLVFFLAAGLTLATATISSADETFPVDYKDPITVRILSGKDGQPLAYRHLVLVAGYDQHDLHEQQFREEVLTDAHGQVRLSRQLENLPWLQVWVSKSPLCMGKPGKASFSVELIRRDGLSAPNRCGTVTVEDEPGVFTVFVKGKNKAAHPAAPASAPVPAFAHAPAVSVAGFAAAAAPAPVSKASSAAVTPAPVAAVAPVPGHAVALASAPAAAQAPGHAVAPASAPVHAALAPAPVSTASSAALAPTSVHDTPAAPAPDHAAAPAPGPVAAAAPASVPAAAALTPESVPADGSASVAPARPARTRRNPIALLCNHFRFASGSQPASFALDPTAGTRAGCSCPQP